MPLLLCGKVFLLRMERCSAAVLDLSNPQGYAPEKERRNRYHSHLPHHRPPW
jgi:hypothetical protein